MGSDVSISEKEDKNKIDLSIPNIWRSWYRFRQGKGWSWELHEFQYHLEENIQKLFIQLNDGMYRHGPYRTFTVTDNKKREISVASIRDRVVHRLMYDYLNDIYDKTFIYDAWSCRVGKGLNKAIHRTRHFLNIHRDSYVWRADIRKFFDSVNQQILLKILTEKITDPMAITLLGEIISGFDTHTHTHTHDVESQSAT
jgi:retron-type reverse transcriptase